MEVNVGQHTVVPLDGQGVVADEQVFVTFEAEHSVAGAEADQARVGCDADDRCVEVDAGFGVPARVEWGGVVEAVMGDGDRGDAVSSHCRAACRRAHL